MTITHPLTGWGQLLGFHLAAIVAVILANIFTIALSKGALSRTISISVWFNITVLSIGLGLLSLLQTVLLIFASGSAFFDYAAWIVTLITSYIVTGIGVILIQHIRRVELGDYLRYYAVPYTVITRGRGASILTSEDLRTLKKNTAKWYVQDETSINMHLTQWLTDATGK